MKKLASVLLLLALTTGCATRGASSVKVAGSPAQTLTSISEQPLNLKIVASRGHRVLTTKQLIDKLAKADIVCVGETHDSEVHHRLQLEIIEGLQAHRGRLGIGMEMFQRPFQPQVDRYLSGESTEAVFLTATEWDSRWGFDYKLYRPIIDFARSNHLPLAALNASRELTHRIMQVGYSGLTDAERNELGPVDFNVKAHRDHWFELIPMMHGTQKMSAEQQERTYAVMTVWDDYMAQSAASFYKEKHLRRLVVLAGAGHIDGNFGIADRAARYAHAKRATVKIVIGDETSGADDGLPVDYTVYVLPQSK